VDAGEYKVIARFANNDPNYETIPDMETALKILPAVYTVLPSRLASTTLLLTPVGHLPSHKTRLFGKSEQRWD
ncbi:MAG: hypothetical protein IIX81_00215, partial [Tidjanibacter sp.]|nr:hypothetical protein [Tidjanibacter sp.]